MVVEVRYENNGASRPEQLEENVRAFDAPELSAEELAEIERTLAGQK